MRRGVIPHPEFIDDRQRRVHLAGFDFVFVCVDRAAARKLISRLLQASGHAVHRRRHGAGAGRRGGASGRHLPRDAQHTREARPLSAHVSLAGDAADDVYATNIQVADLNALNAALAVLKWKKFCGFYQDCDREHQSRLRDRRAPAQRDETETA